MYFRSVNYFIVVWSNSSLFGIVHYDFVKVGGVRQRPSNIKVSVSSITGYPVSGISQFLRCHSGTYDATGICFCSMNPTRQSISFLIDRCFSSYFCSDIANCNRPSPHFCGKLQIARKICQHVSRRPLHIITNKHSSRGVVCTF